MSLEYRIDHRGVVQLQAARQRNLCWPLLVVLLLLLLVVTAWLYVSGYLTPVDSTSGTQALSLRGKMNEQARLLEEQQQHIIKLESQAASATRSEQVQATANVELQRKLELAETELANAKDNLLLYEEILSPKDVEAGLSIRHFGLKPRLVDLEGNKLPHERFYQYQLVLANVRGNEAGVAGRYNLEIKGLKAGAKVNLQLDSLRMKSTEQNQDVNHFSLKYYQRFEGIIELPPEFTPEQVIVTLRPESGANSVTKSYDWQSFNLSKKSAASKE
ncbi:DUF6776 family protein [uncultured Thiothrix sp.]|uniref:DUF6776 family protein n=1 Tax=uncultured Thiothrix sp. TaxID=223185 RepID=UPI0026368B18|nr:DUF6776 family protein [uncultured Thiothrix sp.]